MRHPRVLAVLTLILCSSFVGAQPSSTDTVIVRAIRSLGFDALYSEARAEGTIVGFPAESAGRLLFASGTGLSEAEREALLLALLLRTREDPAVRQRLRAVLLPRVEHLADWSLLAELLSPPAVELVGGPTLRRAHLELARRILIALESSLRGSSYAVAGYEPAAIALANGARAHSSRAEAASPSADLVLAETLREIGRLSRSLDVVEALDLAVRELLE